MKNTYENFKFILGETFLYCQTIERDVKWIYAIMCAGDLMNNYQTISLWTLGTTVKQLEMLDNQDDKPFLSFGDYKLLKHISSERNYLAHQIYRDFVYQDDFLNSESYKNAFTRLEMFHDQLEKLSKTMEKVRLEALAKYRNNKI